MSCRMCGERGQTWSGGAPTCSFESGVFSNKGWNCATANAIRELMERGHDEHRYDCWRTRMDDESCGILWFSGGYIVGTWYKDRGRTGMLVLMLDEQQPKPLTLEIAEAAIAEALSSGKEHSRG